MPLQALTRLSFRQAKMLPGAIPVTFWSRARLLDRENRSHVRPSRLWISRWKVLGLHRRLPSRLHASRVGALRHASALRQEARVAGRRRALAKGPIDLNCHTAFN